MTRETVTKEVVKCDGCGRVIDPGTEPNFGNPSTPDAGWKHDNMVTHNGLTLVCYAVHTMESPDLHEGGYREADCCEHCMRELARKMRDLI